MYLLNIKLFVEWPSEPREKLRLKLHVWHWALELLVQYSAETCACNLEGVVGWANTCMLSVVHFYCDLGQKCTYC